VIAFAATCDAIAATTSKLAKIDLVASYLRGLDDDDLEAATRFFTGNPFAARDERTLSLGGRTIVAAAERVWGVDDAALGAAYRATGDLGRALGPFVRPPADLGLFRETLTPAGLRRLLEEVAAAAGPQAQRRRRALCERILGACTDPLEATYVIKILTGELRIGLREGLIGDAIAAAFDREPKSVRRAMSAAGDVGAVALAARRNRLDHIAVGYHSPIAPMLATPIPYADAYPALATGTWLVEDKYDGIRIQAHVTPERISLFSRALSDAAGAFPEIAAALRVCTGALILDGEIVAERNGRVLPFRALQTRLQRKDPPPELIAEIPARYVVFDLLASGERVLLDLPLGERRALLVERLAGIDKRIAVADAATLESADPTAVAERFADARERGNEGLMFKRSDSPYAPGRRGKWWLKLKRELSTLDCVVVAVEWGHGRRAAVLSDYTFAVWGPDGFVPIGKAYGGLTDVEIAEMTGWFLAHRLPEDEARRTYAHYGFGRGEIPVEPSVVVEIAFDVIMRSARHASGYALRFPRIVRLRLDKAADDADTLARVDAVYAEMLAREGVAD
jgi:DNA ligase 1